MKAAAYCARSFIESARQVIGAEPVTCPLIDHTTFPFDSLKELDFWYVDLHGEANMPKWFGDGGIVAATSAQIALADLSHCIVFAANCHAGDDSSPMLKALLAAKARWVVAAPGTNYSPAGGPLYGAALLAQWFYKLLCVKISPVVALKMAKTRVSTQTVLSGRDKRMVVEAANDDAMGFTIYKGA